MRESEKRAVAIGAIVIGGALLMRQRSTAQAGPSVPAPVPANPRPPVTSPITDSPPAGWVWPLPSIRIGNDGMRTDGVDGDEYHAVISNPFKGDHEGVDILYKRGLTYLGKGNAEADSRAKRRTASGYPPRITNGGVIADSHDGTKNYFCPPKVLCFAVQAGRVWASSPTGAKGAWVLVDHGSYTTYYTHLSSTTVPKCENGFVAGTKVQHLVARGQALGIVGYDPSTPTSTVRHLHLQLTTYPSGVRRVMDPAPYLAAAQRFR